MFPLITDQPLTPTQIAAATRLLLYIAHVDGARTAEEVALIRQFYDACRSEAADLPAFDDLDASGDVSTADFADPGQRAMLLAFCQMVAYADGELSTREREAVAQTAARLDITDERRDAILAQVKDYMLAQLAGLPDAASVATVARELG